MLWWLSPGEGRDAAGINCIKGITTSHSNEIQMRNDFSQSPSLHSHCYSNDQLIYLTKEMLISVYDGDYFLFQPCVLQPSRSDPQVRAHDVPPVLQGVRQRHRIQEGENILANQNKVERILVN